MKDLDSYLGEAIDNIREDRGKAKEFLEQLEEAVSEAEDTYNLKHLGLVAAKYLETLQRSNEQLVKVAALLQKKQGKLRKDQLRRLTSERDEAEKRYQKRRDWIDDAMRTMEVPFLRLVVIFVHDEAK